MSHIRPTEDVDPRERVAKVGQRISEFDSSLSRVSELTCRMEKVMKNCETVSSEKLDVGELVTLDRAYQIAKWIETIERIGSVLDGRWSGLKHTAMKCAKKEDHTFIVEQLYSLMVIAHCLSSSSCAHVRAYAVRMLECHMTRWTRHLETQLEELLAEVSYPKCLLSPDQLDAKLKSLAPDVMTKVQPVQALFTALCRLRLPQELADSLPSVPRVDPLAVFLKPLKQRFKYHFYGARKTNRKDKPEWYLQQVAAWMRHSQSFFNTFIEPCRKWVTTDFPGHTEFCSGLLSLVLLKLRHNIDAIMYDDVVLSHLVDEVLLVTRDLYKWDSLDTMSPDFYPVSVLCQPDVFAKWISLERKFAFEKVDDILLEEGSWMSSASKPEVSKCMLTLEAVLQSVTNRYKVLHSKELQLKFVQLQIELLEDLRLRFVQILRSEFPLSEKFCLMLNSAQYLVNMLTEWCEIPLFMQLQLERNKRDDELYVSKTLFHNAIDSFDFLVQDMLKTLSDHVFDEVRSRSNPYKVDLKWFSYVQNQVDPTPESYAMFQMLVCHLNFISSSLSQPLMTKFAGLLCDRLCTFFITDIILENSFSPDGCKQIMYDVNNVLLAVFVPYNFDRSSVPVQQLSDIDKLFQLSTANALLLCETLQQHVGSEPNGLQVLAEFHVHRLSAEQCVKVLRRRIDVQRD